jgi:hypothetical protein
MTTTFVANLKDDRFGRLFVQFASARGKPAVLAASRVLFADSFYAAMDALSVTSNEQARFRNGEILVLMSMDPDAELTKQEFAKVKAAAEELEKRAERVTNAAEMRKLLADLEALKARTASERREIQRRDNTVPRGIVVHPSIVGRDRLVSRQGRLLVQPDERLEPGGGNGEWRSAAAGAAQEYLVCLGRHVAVFRTGRSGRLR